MFLSKISQFYYQLLLGLNENGWVTLLLSMFSLSLKILREMVLTFISLFRRQLPRNKTFR